MPGRPLAVGGRAETRGVIATCNYEARAFGVHSAMPTARAQQLCPQLILLPPDFERYRAASRRILAIYRDYTPLTVRSDIPVFAFSRRWGEEHCICVARTRVMPGRAGSVPSRDAVVVPGDVDGPWMSLLSSRVIDLGRNGAPGTSKFSMASCRT